MEVLSVENTTFHIDRAERFNVEKLQRSDYLKASDDNSAANRRPHLSQRNQRVCCPVKHGYAVRIHTAVGSVRSWRRTNLFMRKLQCLDQFFIRLENTCPIDSC